MQEQPDGSTDLKVLNENYGQLMPEIDAMVLEMRSSFS
jgi:hypothetical protein